MKAPAGKAQVSQAGIRSDLRMPHKRHFADRPIGRSAIFERRHGDSLVPTSSLADTVDENCSRDLAQASRSGFDFSRVHLSTMSRLQPKLTVNTPGDVYEQDADRVASQVMTMRQARATSAVSGNSEKRREEPIPDARLQMHTVAPNYEGGIEAPTNVSEVLNSPGQPLDQATRDFMEPRFGHDFGYVRVHADARAAAAADAIGARAFTVGQRIVFGVGEFVPQTERGSRLISHELAHVLQQGARRSNDEERVMRQAKTQPEGKPQFAASTVPGFNYAFGEMIKEWLLMADTKERIVSEIASAYVNSVQPVEKKTSLPIAPTYQWTPSSNQLPATTSLPVTNAEAAVPFDPFYNDVYWALFSALDPKKIGDHYSASDWVWRDAPARSKTKGEKREEIATFVTEEFITDKLQNAAIKTSVNWASKRALQVGLTLAETAAATAATMFAIEIIGFATLVIGVAELIDSLQSPAEPSPHQQKNANIVAAVKDWLRGKQEAAELAERLKTDMKFEYNKTRRDETRVVH